MRTEREHSAFYDRRDFEIERLKRERDELRAREQRARTEAEEAQRRLTRLTATSRAFASSFRNRTEDRRQTSRRLAAQYSVTRALTEAEGLQEAAPKILKLLGAGLGWSFGVLWMVDEEADVLRCDEIWRSSGAPPSELAAACRKATIPRGADLPGRVWERGEPVWVEDFLGEEGFLGMRLTPEQGLRNALAFPIRGSHVLGVFEFFGREVSPPDEDLLRMSASIGEQIGQFVERRQAQKALRESEERYKALYEDTPSLYFTLDVKGTVLSVNRFGANQLGYTAEELVGFSMLDIFHEEDREGASRAFEKCLQESNQINSWEARKVRKDGSTVWVRENIRVVRRPEGGTIILVACEDITERRRAEEERERSLTRELQIRAQAEERRRISRELHDRVAHSMGVVHQSLELYQALKERDPTKAEARIELAGQMAKEALASTRNLSMELRRPEIQRGLESALVDLLRDVVPPAMRSELAVEGDEELIPPGYRNQLFLILREAVRNAVAHSGCNRIVVKLDITPERAEGAVEDDGRGFDPEERRSGDGFKSMEERASLVGGAFDISSEPRRGTTVKVSVPLEEDV